jgi:flagellar hook-basal body complex protein FliE
MSISSIGATGIQPPQLQSLDELARPQRKDQLDLGGSFAHALEQAHASENTATDSAEKFAKGDPGMGIHEVMIASEKANIAIRYATTLKNKALEAYKELMNTQV